MRTTKGVLEHHHHARSSANLEEIGKDYNDNSKLISAGNGMQSGKKAILKFFEGMLPIVKEGSFKIKSLTIEDKAALLVWDFDSPTASVKDGVDTFFIEDDFIRYQTAVFNLVRKS